ncbi:ferrous iron transport protein B [Agarilytica rhodophyticola]|uniref:ferrous iron transport protein B n=1 Tax=Agarilytica rhodophyticola TaxID=1737490 RepID=UPI000B347A93|nr:ferrous iron transport protein B [Agarilytica rhodophyticola]
MKTFRIALAGNPNCGKTTLFNDLTGSRQKVANWAGVTVEKKTGIFKLDQHHIDVTDLPGIYSLNSEDRGLDEEIARNFLYQDAPDLVFNIVDAANLNRHLLLTQELLALGCPTIVILNMMDVARQQGVEIDIEQLQNRLGVPVVPIVASRNEGLPELRTLTQKIIEQPDFLNTPNSAIVGSESSLAERYHWIKEQTGDVVMFSPQTTSLTEKIDRIVLNRWLGIPIFLLMMYLMFMLAINLGAVFIDFFDIFLGALLVDSLGGALGSIGAPDWLVTIVADGIGGGIQLVGTFIPVIGFLYLCLSVLEDSGYMARAAFVVDRLMSRIGLPGNSFVPLIIGFGCNVPSVMASRSLTREQDRLLTIAMAPFMSCGARLTVYALFAAAFFPNNGTTIVFALYMCGILVAVFTGWLFRKTLFSGQASPSFQEMPAYHIPTLRNILTTSWHRLRGFIVRAGSTIIKVVTVLTIVNSIGIDGSFGNQDSQDSMLSKIGKTLTPVLAPIGVKEENWPATVGIFTGVFAKEAVVGTLDALYQDVAGESADEQDDSSLLNSTVEAFVSIGNNLLDLSNALLDPIGLGSVSDSADEQGVSNTGLRAMQSLFETHFAAFCYLVLILLYTPCVAVIGAMQRESGWYWSSLVVAWSSFLAYWTASCLYQIGTFMQHPKFSIPWLLGASAAMYLAVLGLRRLGEKSLSKNENIIASSR